MFELIRSIYRQSWRAACELNPGLNHESSPSGCRLCITAERLRPSIWNSLRIPL